MNADMASTNNDNNVRQLANIADIYGLRQLISEPTRITDKSATLIDLIFTNCPERVVCSGVAHISISDHSLVYVFRKLSINFRKGHTSVMYRNFKTFNRAKFRNDIYNENWEFLDSSLDPNVNGFWPSATCSVMIRYMNIVYFSTLGTLNVENAT